MHAAEEPPASGPKRVRAVLLVLPWLLLLGGLLASAAQNLTRGYGLLFVLIPAWLLTVMLLRAVSGRLRGKGLRLVLGAALIAICLVAWPFGGWWVLPAAVAFLLLDALVPAQARPSSWRPPARLELVLGGLTLLAAIAITIWLANAAFYSYASTTVSTTGEVTNTQGSYGLPIATGLVFLVLPAAFVVWGVIRDRQDPGSGRPMIGTVAAALAVLSVLGGFSIGAFLVPIALLALLTFLAAPKRSGR